VAEPARRPPAPGGVPTYDPTAVGRRYAAHRARRDARVRRRRARKYARIRFAATMVVLLALCGFIALTAWREVEHLFGL
jgi:hypothetical protein